MTTKGRVKVVDAKARKEIEGGLELIYCRACHVDDCKRLTRRSTSGCVTSKGFVYSAFLYLRSKGYVKLSKNQDIPDNPYELYSYGARIQHQEDESKGFKCCAEQMIKDNFRRIEEG